MLVRHDRLKELGDSPQNPGRGQHAADRVPRRNEHVRPAMQILLQKYNRSPLSLSCFQEVPADLLSNRFWLRRFASSTVNRQSYGDAGGALLEERFLLSWFSYSEENLF
jgi:hypothetical protein